MSAKKQNIGAPGLPQVNLLPPEIRAARGVKVVKRWLAGAVALSIVLAAGLVGLAVLTEQEADDELALAQAETDTLLAEQLKYAEVPIVLGQLDTIKQARETGMSTEVLWQQYFQALGATAPEDVRIEHFVMTGATPSMLPFVSADPLQAPSVSTIQFEAVSITLIDTEDWLEQLATIPGFADAWFSSAATAEYEGIQHYTVMATVQINDQAYANRFVDVEEEEE